MRSIIVISVILTIFLSCKADRQTREVVGSVTNPAGQPFKQAHVHVFELGGSPYSPLLTAAVEPDGWFRIELPDFKYYQIAVTAVDHQMSTFPLFADHRKPISVDIRLAPNVYKEKIDEVRITGSWNQFNVRTAEPMIKSADGTFRFTLETDVDTIGYQLADIDANSHTVNGPMADFFEYDGGGDYKSIILVKEGKVEIIFDPAALPEFSGNGLPKATYDTHNKNLEKMAVLSALLETHISRFREEQRASRSGGVTPGGIISDFSSLKTALRDALNQTGDALLGRYAAVLMGRASSIFEDFPMQTEEYKAIVQRVPVTDPMWLVSPNILDDVFGKALGKEQSIVHFVQNLPLIENKSVKVYALLAIGYEARANGDLATQTMIYNELDSAYAEFRDLSYYVRNLNPDLRISPGKTVPDFTVELMENGNKVSRDTFKGQYLLLDFWATWCGPCLTEMAGMHQAWDNFKSKKFQILSLSFDQSPDDVMKFREERWNMPWLHTFVEKGFENELSKKFEVMGIPKPILIDHEGNIVAVGEQLRGTNLDRTLSAYLN